MFSNIRLSKNTEENILTNQTTAHPHVLMLYIVGDFNDRRYLKNNSDF